MSAGAKPEESGRGQEPFVRLRLAGDVTEFSLARTLGGVIRPGQDQLLLVDCSDMRDYTPEARELFIDWNRAHKKDILAVAVVSRRNLWQLVVSTMALASAQRMRSFESVEAAESWLSTFLPPRPEISRVRTKVTKKVD